MTGAGERGGRREASGFAGRLPLSRLERRDEGRALAGVCSGIAAALGVDPTLVRLVFALLALAGASGAVLYVAAWLLLPAPGDAPRRGGRARTVAGAALLLAAGLLALRGLGLADSELWPAALAAVGVALMWRRRSTPDAPALAQTTAGAALIVGGVLLFVAANGFDGPRPGVLGPGSLMAGLLLVVVPSLWRLARERDLERTERVRSEERAEIAARVHDSVLQTLALIQREAGDPRRVATLARRQERELRAWLYGDASRIGRDSLVAAVEEAAADVEELHGIRVETVSAGDCALDERLRALVLAAREAMANAAKFSGTEDVSVYVEATDGQASVFVRDRGAGFDRAAVPTDRRGIAESIEARMARHGGSATVTSAPGQGTEVELVMPRGAA